MYLRILGEYLSMGSSTDFGKLRIVDVGKGLGDQIYYTFT
jgi:hypothetical protein